MIQEAYDSYVHEVYMELYQTLTEGTQQIRLNNYTGDAEVITNNGYIFHPSVDDMNGAIFFRGQRIDRPYQSFCTVWFAAKDYPELAKLVREKLLPDVVEQENNYKIERLKAN
ncbi:MAG: hypothetical protein KBS40_01365 [Bacteroidales bacterium]|nr:hypothetical protein [Bacteroidales bacterium]